MSPNSLFRLLSFSRCPRVARTRLYVEELESRSLLSTPAVIDVVGHLPVTEYNQFIRDAVNFEGNPFKDWGNEPMIAVNPVNPDQIVISSFAYGSFITSGLGGSRASLWYSTDGGADWGIRFPITESPAPGQMVPNDQAIAYDSSGTLHMASLTYNVAGLNSTAIPSLNVFHGSTTDPNADGINGRPADLWQWSPNQVNLFKKSFNQADQPWITVGGSNVYVGYGAWDTSGLYLRVSASSDNGATFTSDNNVNSNSGISTAENPGLRLATDKVGNVYSIFGWSDQPFQTPQPTHYRLNMSSDGGQTWKYSKVSSTKYGGLAIDDGLSLQPNKFGDVNALYGNITAIAADDAGQHIYTVYGKEDSTGVDRIWLAEFHPDGQGGLAERANRVALSVPGQRSALPSIAVTDNGTVFVMYDSFDGTLFHVHLATSTDQGQTFSDQDLYDFTATGIPYPYLTGNRLFGDYQFLTAVGNTVYGTFAARGNVNDPNTLIDTTDQIDPFFFTVSTKSKSPALAAVLVAPAQPLGQASASLTQSASTWGVGAAIVNSDLPFPGQAKPSLPAATTPAAMTASPVATQASDFLFTVTGKKDGASDDVAALDAEEGTGDGWGQVLGQATWWQDPIAVNRIS